MTADERRADERAAEAGAADDGALVRAASRGDTAAFSALYDRHAPQVFGLLLRMLPARQEAEDALQETFLRAWRNLDGYRPELCSVLGWITMIARSRALDILRGRRPTATGDAGARASERGESRELERQERDAAVSSAIDRLPVEQGALIRAAFFEGLTHEEIADRTGEPLGTVKSRIRLGVRRLRDMATIHELRDS